MSLPCPCGLLAKRERELVAVKLMLVEPVSQLLKSPRPCRPDPAEGNSGYVGHLSVGPGAVGEQCPQQSPPTRGQFSDELP